MPVAQLTCGIDEDHIWSRRSVVHGRAQGYAQAKFDFESFVPRLADNGLVLFHDSVRVRWSRIYGEDKAFEHRVKDFMDELKTDPRWQVFDLPFGDGVTLVRRSQ